MSCRAAAYTAMLDKDRARLLLSCSLVICPLAPWKTLPFLLFYHIVIELSFIVVVIEISRYFR